MKKAAVFLLAALLSLSVFASEGSADGEESSAKEKITGVLNSISGAINKAGSKVKSGVDGKVSAENVNESFKDAQEAADKAQEEITPEQEYYIGRAVAAKILAKYKVYNSPKAQKYLNVICRAIAAKSERPDLYRGYFVVILDTDEINAFATPGGHIMVTRGLLKCTDSEDSLAAVLSHEIAHILLQHSVKAIKKSRTANAVVKTGSSIAMAASGGNDGAKENLAEFSESVDAIVANMLEHGYSKSQEFAADAKALELMANAGYNPRAMDSMLNMLDKNTPKDAGSGFGKTHPSPQARLKNVSSKYGKYKVNDTSAARKKRFSLMKPNF